MSTAIGVKPRPSTVRPAPDVPLTPMSANGTINQALQGGSSLEATVSLNPAEFVWGNPTPAQQQQLYQQFMQLAFMSHHAMCMGAPGALPMGSFPSYYATLPPPGCLPPCSGFFNPMPIAPPVPETAQPAPNCQASKGKAETQPKVQSKGTTRRSNNNNNTALQKKAGKQAQQQAQPLQSSSDAAVLNPEDISKLFPENDVILPDLDTECFSNVSEDTNCYNNGSVPSPDSPQGRQRAGSLDVVSAPTEPFFDDLPLSLTAFESEFDQLDKGLCRVNSFDVLDLECLMDMATDAGPQPPQLAQQPVPTPAAPPAATAAAIPEPPAASNTAKQQGAAGKANQSKGLKVNKSKAGVQKASKKAGAGQKLATLSVDDAFDAFHDLLGQADSCDSVDWEALTEGSCMDLDNSFGAEGLAM